MNCNHPGEPCQDMYQHIITVSTGVVPYLLEIILMVLDLLMCHFTYDNFS